MKQVMYNGLNGLYGAIAFLLQLIVDPLGHLFVRLRLPAAVAAHEDEVAVLCQWVLKNVRIRRDRMLLRLQAFLLLKLQITQSSRQIEVAIDTTFLDDAS